MAYLRSSIGRITTSDFPSDPVPGASSLTAVASGAIVGGKGVIINSDGTVSVCEGAQGSRSEGTPVVFEEATTSDIAAVYDSVEDQVWVAYRDEGNLNKGTVVNGTVSGTTITWGNPFVFAAAATSMISIAYDANQEKAVISHRDDDNSNYGTSCVVNYDGRVIPAQCADEVAHAPRMCVA
jgi:hypothetical protein